ncbi:MAG: hypothetical protein M3680_20180 [Myxococcota bacterium]|nr:hypothetical protein [Myxococcota bacterium]
MGDDKKQQVLTLGQLGWSLREIEEAVHVRRETASGYLKAAGIAVRAPRKRRLPAATSKPASGEEVSTDLGDDAAPKPASGGEVSSVTPRASPRTGRAWQSSHEGAEPMTAHARQLDGYTGDIRPPALLVLCVACDSAGVQPDATPDARLEIADAPVVCGGGARSETLGSLTDSDGTRHELGVGTPRWTTASSDSPALIQITTDLPRLAFSGYGKGAPDPEPPRPGEATGFGASVDLSDTSSYSSRTNRIVTDVSDAGCLAGRFEVDFAGELHGRLVGWFRTQ